MAQGFVTGFAFVYVLDKLAATMADPEAAEPTVKGRQALESAAATKGRPHPPPSPLNNHQPCFVW